MKKIIISLSLVFSVLFVFAACGSETANKVIDIHAVMDEITSSVQMPEETMNLTTNDDLLDYFGVDGSLAKDFAVVRDANYVGTELAIFEANDESSAQQISNQLNTYITEQIETYQSYEPDYAYLLQNSNVNINGVYVSLFVSENASEIVNIYNSYFN
ncbi:MAG: DUF4358 domain-containing protein [Clostridia bacterium]|nr:DUF4358 domain-containing protein [Clostridia bacterium]